VLQEQFFKNLEAQLV